MKSCIHCGGPSSGEYALVFDGESGSREMDLFLCDACVELFEEQPDVQFSE